MLHLHFSNRYETLSALLVENLAGEPRDVFTPAQVVVPSAAVRRSLTLAIAGQQGVCTQVEFAFLARWLWQQIGRLVPGVGAESPFAPALLVWRVYTALGESDFVAGQTRLAGYLVQADAAMRYELARRVAALFEQYITYRPDWLLAWRQGRPAEIGSSDPTARADERWQAALWQRLTSELGIDALHPAAAFIDALRGADAAAAGLPAQAHVFALPAMPPLHRQLLQRLGEHIELHVYALNPCSEFWFELVEARRLSHLAARGRADGHETGHRLLAAWGRQTQAQIGDLVDVDGAVDDGDYSPLPGDTLLARLHNSVLDLVELEPGSVALADDDRSFEVHVCHSLTRELEVLHDHLLGCFAADAALRPSDILVVVPDLEAAAPLIDAIFGTVPRERFIAYTVSGRPRSQANAAAQALLALLALVASRCTASALFGVLQQPLVARRFGLDDDALDQIRHWMRDSGLRWALDAAHRASFDLPASARHTLADALDRLFLGHALPADSEQPFAGLLPAGAAEGTAALALGAFWRFAQALQALHDGVTRPCTPADWAALLRQTLAQFLAPAGDQLDELRELQQTITELAGNLASAGVEQALPLAVLRAALEQLLDDPARGGVPTGNVTFSAMGSLRNLPFAIVCAIGLDDGVFPSAQRAPEFDLMALQPRRGDRQRRHDERNLFLDLLLGARQAVYLSHTGRSVRDNSVLPPSVLVAELLDLLVPAIASDPGSTDALAQARHRLVVAHPLQPFAIEAFRVDGDPRLRSFNRELGEALQLSLGPASAPAAPTTSAADEDGEAGMDDSDEGDATDTAPPTFFSAPLPAPGPEWRSVSLAQLVEFFRNPSRFLLRRRLGIALVRDAEVLEDDEPFLPDWSGRQALAQRLLPALLAGADLADARALAQAGTELPAGALGAATLEDELRTLQDFAARVRAATGGPALPPHSAAIEIELDAERWRIDAGFADLRPDGLQRWRCDSLRPGDRLEAWLQHLLLCAGPPAGVQPHTRWLALDTTLEFRPADEARALLQSLLRLYRRGLREPLHFFPKSAWAYLEADAHLPAAEAVWRASRYREFAESTDPAHRLALRGQPEPLDGEFAALAEAVYGPLRAHSVDPQAAQ